MQKIEDYGLHILQLIITLLHKTNMDSLVTIKWLTMIIRILERGKIKYGIKI